jgi:hypothetical protein
MDHTELTFQFQDRDCRLTAVGGRVSQVYVVKRLSGRMLKKAIGPQMNADRVTVFKRR